MSETKTKTEKRVPVWVLALYMLMLFAAWSAYQFLLAPTLEAAPNELLGALLGDGLCKNAVWTLPAVLLILKYKDALAVKPSELFSWKKEHAVWLLAFPAFCAYIAVGMIANHKAPAFDLTVKELVAVLFVGVTEELVFRAWLLNAAAKYIPESKPVEEPEEDPVPWAEYGVIALNAALFLSIHFPRWIREGVFVTNMTQLGFVSIILLSVIFSVVFLRTKNIVLPIVLHMFWDLLIFMLY